MASFMACGHGGDRAMDRAERLIDSATERSLSILDSLRQCDGEMDQGRMARLCLLRQLARHKLWHPIDVDSQLMASVAYYNIHGTPNQRMLAFYLLGYGYSEHGWNSEAQQCYFKAINAADTTADDCDFSRLAKVYGQLTCLYYRSVSPQVMLDECGKTYRYATIAGDTLLFYVAKMQRGIALSNCGKKGEALEEFKEVYRDFLSIGDTAYACHAADHIGRRYLERQEVDSAERYIRLIEPYLSSHSDYISSYGLQGFYSLKGEYCMMVGEMDSASYYFYKEYALDDLYQKTSACGFLSDMYHKMGKTDSAYFYSNKYIELNSQLDSIMEAGQLQEARSRYIYDELNSQIKEKEKQVEMTTAYLMLAILLIIVITTTSVYFYRQSKLKWEKLKIEYASLKESLYPTKNQTGESTNKANDKIKELESGLSREKLWRLRCDYIQNLPAIISIRNDSEKSTKLSADKTTELESIVKETFPNAYNLIMSKALNNREISTCFLILIGLRQSRIATLLSMTEQGVSSIRKRLGKKLFNMQSECKASEFDRMLRTC